MFLVNNELLSFISSVDIDYKQELVFLHAKELLLVLVYLS